MKRILFCSDLTARAQRAGSRARLLQQQFNADLTALHVLDADLPEALRKRRTKEAEEMLRAELPDAAVEVAAGVDYATIVERAQDHDLIVVGTHRHSLRDVFVGTTVERVLRTSTRPLLMVTSQASIGYGRAVVGVDLSPSSQRAAAAAARLAPEAAFHMVHAHDIPFSGYMDDESKLRARHDGDIDAAMAAIESELPRRAARRIVRIGAPVTTLQAACQEIDADLVVLATQGRTGVARAVLGSVAERLIAEPPCDVLVVRAH